MHHNFALAFAWCAFINIARAGPVKKSVDNHALLYLQPATFKNTSLSSNISLPTASIFLNNIPHPIAHTPITLHISPHNDAPIPKEDVSPCILRTNARLRRCINDFGDGPLTAEDDPYLSQPMTGIRCIIAIESLRVPGAVKRLTYSDLSHVLFGLLDFIQPQDLLSDRRDAYVNGLEFEIEHEEWGIIGIGEIWGT